MPPFATAYRERIQGDRAENIEQAIDLYQQTLQILSYQAMPVEWAETMNNLGTLYLIANKES